MHIYVYYLGTFHLTRVKTYNLMTLDIAAPGIDSTCTKMLSSQSISTSLVNPSPPVSKTVGPSLSRHSP